VHVFTQLGAGPYGRIGSGVIELIASVLLFLPNWVRLGAGRALGTMPGAILSHLTLLGIEVGGDGPMLMQKYGLPSFPAFLFIDGNGNVVKQAGGYHNPNALLTLGKQIIN